MAFVSPFLAGILVDMWINIITWLNSNVINYAWAIIILTVIIKLVLLPLDFFNKKVTRKNSKMQQVIQPEMQKLQQQYGNDKNLLNQKMSELYKKNNYNVVGSCLFMLVNLTVTMVIFISLLMGLNQMASNRITAQYETLKSTYYEVLDDRTDETAISEANDAVIIKYDKIKDSFLWIKNIWKADTVTNSIPTFGEYLSVAKQVTYNGEILNVSSLTDEQKSSLETEYNKIMDPLRNKIGSANGYYILLILIVATAILSQWLMQRKMKMPNDQNNPAASTSKIMMFILPVVLGIFALSSNAVFSLYLLASQIISSATTPLIDLIIDKIDHKNEMVKQSTTMASYDRNRTLKTFDKTQTYDKPIKNDKKNKKGE